jgi:hypothetical protein
MYTHFVIEKILIKTHMAMHVGRSTGNLPADVHHRLDTIAYAYAITPFAHVHELCCLQIKARIPSIELPY